MRKSHMLLKFLISFGTISSGLVMFLVGYFGITASAQQSYYTLVAIFFPYLVFVAGFFWVLSSFTRQWKILILQTCFFAISAPMLLHTFSFHLKREAAPAGSIQVMSINVDGFDVEDGKPIGLIDYIHKRAPDIICFQEFMVRPEQYGFTLQQLAEQLSEYPFYDFQVHQTTRFDSGVGIAIFSKFPITGVDPIEYTSRVNSSCLYHIDIHGKKLILVNNHLESNGLSDMDMQLIRGFLKDFRWDYKPLVDQIVDEKIRKASIARMEQVRIVMKHSEAAGGEYVLICGDMNDTPLSPTLRLFRLKYLDSFRQAGIGLGATHRLMHSGLRIDYILHSSNIIPYQYEVGKEYFSDHYPVMCHFFLN